MAVMAAATATISPAAGLSAAMRSTKGRRVVRQITGMNLYGGLKAHNCVASLGVSMSSEQAFAKLVRSVRSQGKGGGGALGASCNVAGEIFRIAAVMNGLVLVGVAVGFVLLRIEAFVEESEE